MSQVPSGNSNRSKNGMMNKAKKSINDVAVQFSENPVRSIIYMALMLIIFYFIYLIGYYIAYLVFGAPLPVYGNGTQLIGKPVDAYDGSIVGKKFNVPMTTEGLSFSYSLWIYVEDWSYQFGKWKNIMVKGDVDGSDGERAPGLWLYPRTNSLHARISTTVDKNEGCDIKNIPLQKWVNIIYVLDNRSVDIYINGKLERSCVLKGIPIINSKPLTVSADGAGFYGKISNLVHYKQALKPENVMDIYHSGPY